MESLKQAPQETEDEVLVSLSNKGIVKRAYKDLENEKPEVSWEEAEAEVRFAEAVCRIRLPLKDSSCSCPSRSMCRHRIAAMLWLKRESDGEEQPFSREELEAKREAVPDKKPEEVQKEKPKTEKKINETQAQELSRLWKEQLILQFSTGLSRLPEDTQESLERLAVLSHRAGFARLERGREKRKVFMSSIFHGRQLFARNIW